MTSHCLSDFHRFPLWNHSGDEISVLRSEHTGLMDPRFSMGVRIYWERCSCSTIVSLYHNYSHFWFKLIPTYKLVLVLWNSWLKRIIFFPSRSLNFSTHTWKKRRSKGAGGRQIFSCSRGYRGNFMFCIFLVFFAIVHWSCKHRRGQKARGKCIRKQA